MMPSAPTFHASVLKSAVLAQLTDPVSGEIRTTVTEHDVRSAFETFKPLLPIDADDSEMEQLIRSVIHTACADIPGVPKPVIKDDHLPWLKDAKSEINWRRWRAYRKMLANQGRSGRVLETLDRLTDDILDLAGDPSKSGTWNKRGLIIGDVQSGKTQNYLALINKAADAGYRLVIILSGNTEYLRRQTHERVDEGFIGRDTSRALLPKSALSFKDIHIGVGKIDQEMANATSLTTVLMDFLQATKNNVDVPLPTNSSGPVVFVLKKNKYVLDAVNEWARNKSNNQGMIDLPVLLLDDESDYASVNTREAEDPTAINGSIRRMLSRFTRSSYVAITATPFANIFIDYEASTILDDAGSKVDDLFPEDYIYPLEAPTNYVGIRAMFGTDDDDRPRAVQALTDAQTWIPAKHKKDYLVGSLPESLREAIRVYLLANAVLDSRKRDSMKRSMLVNVSRFTNVQDQVGELLTEELFQYKAAIELHAMSYANGRTNEHLSELHDTFLEHYSDLEVSWGTILDSIHKSVTEIRVKVYNSSVDRPEDEAFEEDVPARQIAVGGDLLSRGLTLDGLIVSYFHRSVGAADTMMQMARWFGYRDGYQDLCRLWISEKIASDYRFVGAAIEELRDDLRHMHRNNMTPRDFGLAVQQHPESLLITARNKMKDTVQYAKEVNLLGRNLETRKLSADPVIHSKNYVHVQELITAALAQGCLIDRTRRKYLRLNEVPKDLIADLLQGYQAAEDDIFFTGTGLQRMVRASDSDQFQTWDVTFMNGPMNPGENQSKVLDNLIPKESIYKVSRILQYRQLTADDGTISGSSLWVSGQKTRVAGSDDLRKLLGEDKEKEAIAAFESFRNKASVKNAVEPTSTAIPELAFYRYLPRPQLMIYSIEPSGGNCDIDEEKTVTTADILANLSQLNMASSMKNEALLALKIALPSSDSDYKSNNGRVKYILNKVAQKYWMSSYEELA